VAALGLLSRAMFGKIANIFRSKERLVEPYDFASLKVDVHSHFIPGIDDGADTMETSVELVKSMKELGFKKVITTPHVMSDYYKNTPDIINRGCDELRETLVKEGIDIDIECAAEYYLDAELASKIKKKELLTFGDNYVLFELPFISEPPNLASIIFEMQLAGYKPVLAHPERYTFWHLDFEKYQGVFEKGVILQMNINSLTGHYSPQVKKVAQRLIESEMIQLVGSDCHHVGHIQLMNQAARSQAFHNLANSGKLLNNKL
jgi:protein-tyrosine phosphatase